MPIRYKQLGGDLRIADIVFAGSHDASITSGKWNAKTQDKNIGEQAACGVRLFDLRILARSGSGGASLVGYHGSKGGGSKKTLRNTLSGLTHRKVKTHSRMNLGTFGEKLSDMLTQARDFVADTDEFLIFKFDKCTNYNIIAEYCVNILGQNIYAPADITRELGKCTLDELGGHVICVFAEKGLQEITAYGAGDGILGFRSLKGEDGVKPYKAGYPGLQYYGKGGTSVKNVHKTKSGKISENEAKQRKLMLQMAASNDPQASDVLGMMYWTTTGLTHSIAKRNKKMWTSTNVKRLENLWAEGLEQAVSTQLELDRIKYMDYGARRRMKAFFPNIVMIDFADDAKCETIYGLNEAADDRLIKAYDEAVDMGFH